MEAILDEEGLLGYAEGTIATPAQTDATAVAAYTKAKRKCRNKLILAIGDELLDVVGDYDDPKRIWDKLRTMFQPKTKLRRLQAYRDFLMAKLKPEEDMQIFIDRVRQLRRDAIKAGCEQPSDEQMCYVLLMGLPDEYDHVITLTEAMSEEAYTSEKIESLLVGEFRRRQSNRVDAVSDVITERVLLAKRSPEKRSFKPKKETRKCFVCQQVGHLARACKFRPAVADDEQGGAKPKSPSRKSKPKVKTKLQAVSTTMIFANSLDEAANKKSWILDSGASGHMTPERTHFITYEPLSASHAYVANKQKCRILGVGSVSLQTAKEEFILTKVYHVPDITCGIISIGELSRHGVDTIFRDDGCVMVKAAINKVFLRAKRLVENLYEAIDCKVIHNSRCDTLLKTTLDKPTENMLQWHKRLAHTPYDTIQLMKKKCMVKGLEDIPLLKPSDTCKDCQQGKFSRLPFAKSSHYRAKEVLELIHTDLCGAMPTPTYNGFRYYISFIDDMSRKATVYLLKKKCNALEAFKIWQKEVETQTGHKVKAIRTDNGGEYCNKEFTDYLQSAGIRHYTTNVYSPQENGVAERYNRTLMDAVRTMLISSGLPRNMWGEAVKTACHTKNCCPVKSNNFLTPNERYLGYTPGVRHLRPFGCKVFVGIPKQHRDKLAPRAEEGYFVGYESFTKGYRIWIPTKGTHISVSRDVKFEETIFYNDRINPRRTNWSYDDIVYFSTSSNPTPRLVGEAEVPEVMEPRVGGEDAEEENEQVDPEPQAPVGVQDVQEIHEIVPPLVVAEDEPHQVEQGHGMTLRARNTIAKPARYIQTIEILEPATYRDAMSGPQAEQWRQAAQEEFNSLQKMQVWELANLPEGRKPIGNKWVFKLKRDADGKVKRYKARLVAQGFLQKSGIDYFETYAPVAGLNVTRLLIAAAIYQGWIVHQADSETAYLNGDVQEEIYMSQPTGFVVPGQEDKVCRLRRSLYGLKQSGRCWNEKMNTKFLEAGLH